jgi:hypothetical protein
VQLYSDKSAEKCRSVSTERLYEGPQNVAVCLQSGCTKGHKTVTTATEVTQRHFDCDRAVPVARIHFGSRCVQSAGDVFSLQVMEQLA